MRALRFCGLTLGVAAAHLLAFRIAAGEPGGALPLRPVRFVTLAPSPAPASPPGPAIAAATDDSAIDRPPPTRASLHAPAPARDTPGRARSRPRAPAPAPAPARADAGPAWPTYPTRPPPSTTLHYTLVQAGPPDATDGARPVGDAEIAWTRDADAFGLRVALRPAGRPARDWRSTGAFDAAGVAPVRLVERERGRDRRSVNFDRAGGRVRFSSATQALPIAAGAQDRWSWVAQLAAIAEGAAAAGPVAAGTRWRLQVAGLRGDLGGWTFRVLPAGAPPAELAAGNESSRGPGWASGLLHVLREPERPYDLRIEVWLSPATHHLPIGLRLGAPPGPWAVALWARPGGGEEAGAPAPGDSAPGAAAAIDP